MTKKLTITDSIESLVTALGRKSSKRQYKSYRPKSNQYWLTIYRSSWSAEKYIDKTAKDMTKKWRDVKGADTDKLNQLRVLEEQYKVPAIVEEALAWCSLFGEILILAVTDAPQEQYQNELNLNIEELQRFIVIDTYSVGDIDDNIFSKTFGEPLFYTINNVDIHTSRVWRLVAGRIPFSQRKNKGGRGVSDLAAKIEIIKAFDAITTSVSDLIEDSKVDVLKIKGLNSQIAAGREDNVVKYAQLAQEIKSQNNMLLVDSEDDYDQKEIAFSGLADLWVKSREVLSGAVDRPITVMFGQSASGFASGEEDNKAYYETILSLQESRLRPLLDFTGKFLLPMASIDLNSFSYEFPSIDSMNKLDEANIFNTHATGLSLLYQQGLLTGEQVLRELKQKDIFSNISDEDIAKAKEMDNEYNQPTIPYTIPSASPQQSTITPN